jgi:hypothetical protein
LAIKVPSSSTRAMSWWASAQSIPQNTLKIVFLLFCSSVESQVQAGSGARALPNGRAPLARHPTSGS